MSRLARYCILIVSSLVLPLAGSAVIGQEQSQPGQHRESIGQAAGDARAIGGNLGIRVEWEPVADSEWQGTAVLDRLAADRSNGILGTQLADLQPYYDRDRSYLFDLRRIDRRHINIIRRFADNGYELARIHVFDGNTSAAEEIAADIYRILENFDVNKIDPGLTLPLAQYYYLKAMLDARSSGTEQPDFYFQRLNELTERRLVVHDDYWPLTRLRIMILTDAPSGLGLFDDFQNWDEACALVNEVNQLAHNSLTQFLVRCRFRDFQKLKQTSDPAKMGAILDSVQALLDNEQEEARQFNTELPMWYGLARTTLSLRRAELQAMHQKGGSQLNQYRSAFHQLSDSLRNSIPTIENMATINEIFQDDLLLVNFSTFGPQREFEMFGELASSLTYSLRHFPRSPQLVDMYGRSLTRSITAGLRTGETDSLDQLIDQSLTAINPMMAAAESDRQYSERGLRACNIVVQAYAQISVLDDRALADGAFGLVDRQCGNWFRRYPWDLYARLIQTSVSGQHGLFLHRQGDDAAAEPLLTFASNWGVNEATAALIERLKERRLALPDGPTRGVDREQTIEIERQIGELVALSRRQPFEQFTVPVSGGNRTTMSVFITQFAPGTRCTVDQAARTRPVDCIGFSGIEDQELWARLIIGSELSEGVLTVFRRVHEISDNSGISYPALLRYSFGDSNVFEAEGTARTATDSPVMSIDSAIVVTGPRLTVEGDDKFLPATSVSASSNHNCYGWRINTAPKNRIYGLEEELVLPGVPGQMPGVGPESEVFENGRRIVTPFVVSVESGRISRSWCLTPGDPLGTYRFIIRQNGEELASLAFEVVE